MRKAVENKVKISVLLIIKPKGGYAYFFVD